MLYFIAVISRYNHCWESAAISSHSRCCSRPNRRCRSSTRWWSAEWWSSSSSRRLRNRYYSTYRNLLWDRDV